jgi:2-phospho-L-lactate/phosphoenolpyruvate guanylyltransferase
MRWSIVIPVKRLPLAKTRLYDGTRPPAAHRRLALALALDTVGAALACPVVRRVLVVTDDPQAAPALAARGATVVPDRPGRGLNPAVTYGASRATALGPADGIAALSADLPALRPADLASALAGALTFPRSFVPDRAGTGTVLLAARPGTALKPRFGAGSRAAHRASGAVELTGGWPSLRQDVDTAEDLATAAELGLGPATAAELAGQAAAEGGGGTPVK